MLDRARTDEPGIYRKNVLGLFAGLRLSGVDVTPILEKLALRPEDLAELPERLAPDTMTRLWSTIVEVTGRRGHGLALAEQARLRSYDVFGHVVSTCASLGEALLRGVRLFGLLSETVRLSLEVDARRTAVILESLSPQGFHPEAAEYLVGAGVRGATELIGSRVPILEARFRHSAPEDASQAERFFGLRPEYEASWTGTVIDTAILARPIAGHDPVRNAELHAQAERLLNELAADRELDREVLDAVGRCVTDGHDPSLQRVASMLGLHPKTLNRRLRLAGASFRDLQARYRMALAERYLRDPRLTVTDIAFRLGYSEKSAFNRAFRRWRGQSPAEFRAAVSTG